MPGMCVASDSVMDPQRIAPDEVKRRMDSGEAVVFLDSRSAEAHDKADAQIPGSIHVPPDDVESHLDDIPKRGLIVPYCT
jgi:rhodanese-related sulfurtransferase